MAAAAHILGVLEYEAEAGACLAADKYSAVAAGKQARIAAVVVAPEAPGSTRHHWVCSCVRNNRRGSDMAG